MAKSEEELKSLLMKVKGESEKVGLKLNFQVMITLYAREQKRHRCIEQSFGLCGRGRGWDDLGEWHCLFYFNLCLLLLLLQVNRKFIKLI